MFKDQNFCTVDDLMIIQENFYYFYQLKNVEDISWGKVKEDFIFFSFFFFAFNQF